MAKGRKLTASRSERFLDIYGYNNNHGQGTTANNDSTELEEEDVWSIIDDSTDDHSTIGEWTSRAYPESNNYKNRRPPPRADCHHHRQVGGLSLAFDDNGADSSSSPRIVHQFRSHDSVESPHGRHMAMSAPVNVPDWSKIYRVDSVESMHDSDEGFNEYESEVIPPHEYLAREYARTGKSTTNSVFEGVGRTLKGRDLSRVRDAVWSQTGFDG